MGRESYDKFSGSKFQKPSRVSNCKKMAKWLVLVGSNKIPLISSYRKSLVKPNSWSQVETKRREVLQIWMNEAPRPNMVSSLYVP